MTDPRDEITKIIERAERAAYERGWRDGVAAIQEAAERLQTPTAMLPVVQTTETPLRGEPTIYTPIQNRASRRGRPSGKVIDIVYACIVSTPGMKGVDVVRAAQAVDIMIRERTVRTCLRRLRENKAIWKRNGLWYPKPKHDTESPNANGEAVGSPPH